MTTSKKHWTSAEDQTLWNAMEHGQGSNEVVSLLRNRGLINYNKRMRELRKCGEVLKPFEGRECLAKSEMEEHGLRNLQ